MWTISLKKASNTLNFVRCNLKYCPKQKCKEVAYFALVRSSVEYGYVVWDPHTNKEKDNIERINRWAARMVTNDYGLRSCVTAMLTQLVVAVHGEYPLEINPLEKNPPNCNPRRWTPLVNVHTLEITSLGRQPRTPHPEMNPQLMCIPRRKPPSVLAKWLARKTLKNLSVYSIVSLFFAAIVIDCQKRPSVS